MIDATELTKRFGAKVAVDNLSFSVRSGVVTGFLGPNGAGKSTTIRLILGLDRANQGHTAVNGRSYVMSRAPMTEVGALLEAKAVHPGRTARNHMRALAATHGIPLKRVDELLEMVGLAQVARKRVGGYSLGMSQRLGLATALLGDPQTLILDEPVNGLDPEGVAWVRGLVRSLAAQGRTVFISSHLMSEMALTADHVIIVGRGRLIVDAPMSDLITQASGLVTKVRSPNASEIVETVIRSGRTVKNAGDGTIQIYGLTAEAIGEEAVRRGWHLHELTPMQRSLEDIYLELTNSALEFHAAATPAGMVAAPGGSTAGAMRAAPGPALPPGMMPPGAPPGARSAGPSAGPAGPTTGPATPGVPTAGPTAPGVGGAMRTAPTAGPTAPTAAPAGLATGPAGPTTQVQGPGFVPPVSGSVPPVGTPGLAASAPVATVPTTPVTTVPTTPVVPAPASPVSATPVAPAPASPVSATPVAPAPASLAPAAAATAAPAAPTPLPLVPVPPSAAPPGAAVPEVPRRAWMEE